MISLIPQLEVQVAVAKVNKYAMSESGDTVEVVERPHGGLSVVVADGQRSGRSAKAISNLVVRKAISLLADGVRDGAVARATHDYLLTERGGKVSAELIMVSIDLVTRTLVISRNARCPCLLQQQTGLTWLNEVSSAIGIQRNTKPSITEIPIEVGLTLFVCTDGVWSAGSRSGKTFDLAQLLAEVDANNEFGAQALADNILSQVMQLEQQRPQDDVTVLVIKMASLTTEDSTRRMMMRFPI